MRRRVVWRRTDRGSELRDSTVEISRVQKPAARVRGEQSRLLIRFLFADFDACFRFRSCTLTVAKLPQYCRQRRMRTSEIRLQANRFSQRASRFVQLSLLLEHSPQCVPGLRIVWLRVNRGAEFFRCRGEITLLPQRHSQRVVHVRLLRVQFFRLPKFRRSLRQFVFQLQRQSKIVVQRRILWRRLERSRKLSRSRIKIRFCR